MFGTCGGATRSCEPSCADVEAEPVECNAAAHHVHLLVDLPPKVAVSRLVNSCKGVSSRRLRQELPALVRNYWRAQRRWSGSSSAGSVGGAPPSIVRRYIEQQSRPSRARLGPWRASPARAFTTTVNGGALAHISVAGIGDEFRDARSSAAGTTPREDDMTDQPGRIRGIRTIGIPVTDQDAALRFYVGTLGFDKRLDAPLPELGSRWIEVAPSGAAVSVALVQAHEGLPAGGESGVRFTSGNAAALHAELRAAGVDVGELLDWPGVPPMFAFRDPDGNGLEIVEDRPA